MNILYIHGFLSSPASLKARATQAFLAKHHPDCQFVCPALPSYPSKALECVEALVSDWSPDNCGIIGSSLGGFWANVLVERFGFRAVLINPAVDPWRFSQARVGQSLTHYYSDEIVRLQQSDVDFLKACDPGVALKSHYWLLAQEGDETLDYKDAVAKFDGCRQTVLPGGNHSFENFERWLPEILTFLNRT